MTKFNSKQKREHNNQQPKPEEKDPMTKFMESMENNFKDLKDQLKTNNIKVDNLSEKVEKLAKGKRTEKRI